MVFTMGKAEWQSTTQSCCNECPVISMETCDSSNYRYDNFFLHGTDCVSCGLKGQYFWLEKNNDNRTKTWHFNLYGVDENGREVQMTKDHIIPKSCGGKNHVDNYQPMCCRCNLAKSNKQ